MNFKIYLELEKKKQLLRHRGMGVNGLVLCPNLYGEC